jgi:hypothetical protein
VPILSTHIDEIRLHGKGSKTMMNTFKMILKRP